MANRTVVAAGLGLAVVIGLALVEGSTGLAQTRVILPIDKKPSATAALPGSSGPGPVAASAAERELHPVAPGTWTGVPSLAAPAPASTIAVARGDSGVPAATLPSVAPAAGTAPTGAIPPAAAPKDAAKTSVAQTRTMPADVLNKAAGTAAGATPAAPKPPSGPRAATPLTPSPATPAAAGSPAPIAMPAINSTIVIELSRGQVVRLPRPASTVFIANPDIADVQVKSANLVYVFAKKGGETTLIAVDNDDQVMIEARVLVTGNQQRLQDSLRELLPDREITVSSIGEQLVLEGSVGSPADVENARRLAAAVTGDPAKVINRLKISSPLQVMLRVRVAEMSKETSKQLGFNWAVLRDAAGVTPFSLAFTMLNPNNQLSTNSLRFVGRSGPWDVNTLIDAMEDERLVKILAQPTLTAISGQTASFLVGGEFPIPVPQDRDTITIQYKQFGVALAFQPTVLDGNRINLHVRPEISELSDQGSVVLLGTRVPALTVRRAETTVEVSSGQTFALAGLLRNDVTHSINKWPGLADIPILGTLFRSDLFLRKETELIIIVTPYLVEPTNTQLALPTDGFKPPHDVDRIFYGAQWKRESVPGTTNPTAPRARLAGPAGFQLE